jgi:hypothetical protein
MGDEPRDKWSKAEVVSKAVGGILLPVILLYVGNLYTSRQEAANTARLEHDQKRELAQRNADRVTTFLNHLSSTNPTERKLTLQVISYLAQANEFPEELLTVVISSVDDKDPEVSLEGSSALARVAESNPDKAKAIAKAAESSPSVAQSIVAAAKLHPELRETIKKVSPAAEAGIFKTR